MNRQLIDLSDYQIKDLVTLHEAAALLGISYRAVWGLIDYGTLPAGEMGKNELRIPRTAIEHELLVRSKPGSIAEILELSGIKPDLERNKQIASLVAFGWPHGRIADLFEISARRVGQIADRVENPRKKRKIKHRRTLNP